MSVRHSLTEIKEVIKDRRTIYPENFSSRKVHREIVDELLNVAIWAPTHGKTQPWRFKVFSDNGVVKLSNKLAELYEVLTPEKDLIPAKIQKFKDRAEKASVMIAVCMERQESKRIPEVEELAATHAAVQNMLLLATAHGIASFWASPKLIYSEEFKEFLGLGSEDACVGIIYLGYPEEDWPANGQRKPIEYITEYITE